MWPFCQEEIAHGGVSNALSLERDVLLWRFLFTPARRYNKNIDIYCHYLLATSWSFRRPRVALSKSTASSPTVPARCGSNLPAESETASVLCHAIDVLCFQSSFLRDTCGVHCTVKIKDQNVSGNRICFIFKIDFSLKIGCRQSEPNIQVNSALFVQRHIVTVCT